MSVKNFRGGWLVAVALCSCYAMPVFLCLIPNERETTPQLTELKSESISAAFFHRMDSGALVCVHGEQGVRRGVFYFEGGLQNVFTWENFQIVHKITVIFLLLTTH